MTVRTSISLLVRGALVWVLISQGLHRLRTDDVVGLDQLGAVGEGFVFFVLAGLIAAAPVSALIGGRLGGFLGYALYYPEGRFREPPAELLNRLRLMLYDGQIGTAEAQLLGLRDNYPPHPMVYYLLALAQANAGQSPTAILAEAWGKLWPHQRAELRRLLQEGPLPAPQESEWRPSAHIPGFYERHVETPPVEPPSPLPFKPSRLEPAAPPEYGASPGTKLKLRRSLPTEQPPGISGE